MIKKFIVSTIMVALLASCATTQIPNQSGVGRVSENRTYNVTNSNRVEFDRQIKEILDNRNEMIGQQAILFDKKDKQQIKGFMEQVKVDMRLCQSAIDTQNISSRTMLIACEPFFRDLETARYSTNERTLRNYGMGKKIGMAMLALGASAAIAYNSSNVFDQSLAIAGGAALATSIAALPNDWQAIAPYLSKIEANAYNKWLILHINESNQE